MTHLINHSNKKQSPTCSADLYLFGHRPLEQILIQYKNECIRISIYIN